MRTCGRIGLVAAGLLWSAGAFAASLDTPSIDTQGAQVLQPALGRTLSRLADFYVERRVDVATVDKLLVEYEQRLRAAGPDTIIAVSMPVAIDGTVKERPDGARARALYERAAAYGYFGALTGLGDLYMRGDLVTKDVSKAFAAYRAAAGAWQP